jgi:hypothetical protein
MRNATIVDTGAEFERRAQMVPHFVFSLERELEAALAAKAIEWALDGDERTEPYLFVADDADLKRSVHAGTEGQAIFGGVRVPAPGVADA